MSAIKNPERSKRLERLMCAGLCPSEDLEAYAEELKELARELADEERLDKKCALLKAMAHETRLKILHLLSEREMCVCELTVALEGSQPTVSHHIKILENAGLIEDRKEGNWAFYKAADPEFVLRLFEMLESSK